MGLNPLEQLNLITMAALAAIFLATFIVLRKMFFIPLIRAMERRAGKIERAFARYREAEALAGKAREEAKRIVGEAAERAERLSREVKEELSTTRETKCALAGAEADAILAKGWEEVSRLQESEHARLKEQLLECSKKTLAKMIPEVDEDTLRLVVSRVLAARGMVKRP